MKTLTFEGTEEQIKNLMLLIQTGDNDLPEIKTEEVDHVRCNGVFELAAVVECDVEGRYDQSKAIAAVVRRLGSLDNDGWPVLDDIVEDI